jgi:hypothetical protein
MSVACWPGRSGCGLMPCDVARWLFGDAGRSGPRRHRGQCAHYFHAARRCLKDAWVLTDGPVSEFTMLKPSIGVRDLVRAGANLTSRVVENLFWLGRYSERFDDSARMLRVALSRVVESGGGKTPAVCLGHGTGSAPRYIAQGRREDTPVAEGSEHACLKPFMILSSRAVWLAIFVI